MRPRPEPVWSRARNSASLLPTSRGRGKYETKFLVVSRADRHVVHPCGALVATARRLSACTLAERHLCGSPFLPGQPKKNPPRAHADRSGGCACLAGSDLKKNSLFVNQNLKKISLKSWFIFFQPRQSEPERGQGSEPDTLP